MVVIYFLWPTNCNLTEIYVSTAKPATKVLSRLVAAAISVLCSCTIFFYSQSIYLVQITQSHEARVYVLPKETSNTFKDAGDVKAHHW